MYLHRAAVEKTSRHVYLYRWIDGNVVNAAAVGAPELLSVEYAICSLCCLLEPRPTGTKARPYFLAADRPIHCSAGRPSALKAK